MSVIKMPTLKVKVFSLIQILTLCSLVTAEPFYQRRDHRDQFKYIKERNENIVKSRDDAEVLLEKYGYLRCKLLRRKRDAAFNEHLLSEMQEIIPMFDFKIAEEGGREICDEEQVSTALREYQRNYNLPETGELDEETRELMSSSRCGNKDNEAQAVNPNATDTKDGNKETTPNPDTGDETHKKRDERESNKSSPPKQRLRRWASRSSELLKVLMGQSGKESLERRKRHLKEYIAKLKEYDPNIFKDVMENEKRTKRSAIKIKKSKNPDLPVWQDRDENGQMFNKEIIRWRLLNTGYSTRIPVEDQRATIDLAFRMWSEVIPPRFVEDTTGDIRDIDIEIAFGKGSHQNCEQKFDGNGGEIAHSWHTGNMHFDDEENFKSIRSYSPDGIYLLRVAVHEIGHVLGLTHTTKSYSIMYAIYHGFDIKQPEFELGWEDRKAIQQIYGVCKGSFNTVFDWVRKRPDNHFIYNTYFFRGNHYWMYENHANRTRYGDPLYIAREWSSVPDNIDGYVHLWYFTGTSMADEAYFFTGNTYSKYDNVNDKVYAGYPKKIADSFRAKPGHSERIPDNIDSVFFDMRDKNMYFFKNEYVYVFDPKEPEETRGCCVRKRKISEEYPALDGETPLPNNVDAVYYSYKDKAMYFIKGEEHWQNTLFHPRQKVIQNGIKYRGKWYHKWFDICDVTRMP